MRRQPVLARSTSEEPCKLCAGTGTEKIMLNKFTCRLCDGRGKVDVQMLTKERRQYSSCFDASTGKRKVEESVKEIISHHMKVEQPRG